MENYRFVGTPTKVPSNLVEKWGGEYGCPVLDEDRNILGYAAHMPNGEGEVVEAITIQGELVEIVG